MLILLALLASMQGELQPTWVVELDSGVSCCSVAPGGKLVIAGTRTGEVYGVSDGMLKWRIRLGKAVTSLDSAGELALCGTADGLLAIVNVTTGDVISRVKVGSHVTSVSLSSSGEIAAAGTLEGKVVIFERVGGGASYILKTVAKLEYAVKSIAALELRHMVIVGGGMAVYALNLSGGVDWKLVLNDTLTCLSSSERATIVAAGTLGGSLVVKSGRYVNEIQLGSTVLSVDVTEVSKIVTSTSDGRILILDSSGAKLAEYKVSGAAKVVAAAKSGGYIIAGLSNLSLASISTEGGFLWAYSRMAGEPTAVAISDDGKTIVVGSEDCHLYIWDFHGIEISRVEIEGCMEMLVEESYPMLIEIYNRNQYEINVTLSVEGFSFMYTGVAKLEPRAFTLVNLTFTPAKEGDGSIKVRILTYRIILSEKSIRCRVSSLGARLWIMEAPEHAVEGENATVIVRVLNVGVKKGEFEVEVSGKLIKAARRRLFIKEGDSADVALNVTFIGSGEGDLEAKVYYSGAVLAKASRRIVVETMKPSEETHTATSLSKEASRGRQAGNATRARVFGGSILMPALIISTILVTSLIVLLAIARRRREGEEWPKGIEKPISGPERPISGPTAEPSTEEIFRKILEEAREGESR